LEHDFSKQPLPSNRFLIPQKLMAQRKSAMNYDQDKQFLSENTITKFQLKHYRCSPNQIHSKKLKKKGQTFFMPSFSLLI
jgi:hypothetical protein